MKKIIFIVILLVMHLHSAIVLPSPISPKIYHKPLPSLALSFDPQSMDDMYNAHVSSQIYDPLFQFDEFFNVKPHLVDKFEITDNGKRITISLKKGVKFHNGQLLTSDDVIYTIQRFVKRSSRYPELRLIKGSDEFISEKARNMSGLKKLSDLSFEIQLDQNAPTLLMVLAISGIGVLPANLNGSGDEFFEHPIGTGPFKIKTYQQNKILELEANNDYFKGRPLLDGIVYKYANKTEALAGFNKGLYHDLQWYNPTSDELKISYNVAKFAVPRVGVLLFNLNKAPFKNKYVRKAFILALNKEKLMSECFPDKFIAKGYIPYGIGGYDQTLPSSEYNIAEAKRLNSAHLKNPLPITVLWKEYHQCSHKFDKIVKNDLLEAGFEPNIKYVSHDEFWNSVNIKGDYDIGEIILSVDYPEAMPLLNYFKTKDIYNSSGFSDKIYDDFVRKALTTLDRQERYKLYDEAQKILKNEYAVVNLYYDVESLVYQKNIVGTLTPSLPVSSSQMYFIDLIENRL